MTTTERQLDTADLTERVKGMYQEVALHPDHEFHFETGRPLAERLGYPAADLDRIPAAAIDSFAGVGYFLDLAAIAPGEVVLDLGSGSGTDCLPRRARRGRGGQRDRHRHDRRAADQGHRPRRGRRHRQRRVPQGPDRGPAGRSRLGRLRDLQRRHQPLARQARRVRAAAAALRPGGRLAIADIVTATQLPEGVTCDASLWAACIGGAMQRDLYLETIEAAGFEIAEVRENDQYRFISDRADNATHKYGVTSISLLARRRQEESR